MDYINCGPLAYLLAAKAIPGQYLVPLPADEKGYFEKIVELVKPYERLLTVEKVADYFRHVSVYSPDYVLTHELCTVACSDLLLRATEDAGDQLSPRIVEIMSMCNVKRGAFEQMMVLLKEHEKIFA